MIPYFINRYDSLGPQPTAPNYIVRSDLGRGQTKIHSPTISTKMVLSGSEIYTSTDNQFSIERGQFLIAVPEEPFELTIESSAVGCCFYFDIDYVNRMISELISEDLEGGNYELPCTRTIRLPLNGSELGLSMLAIAKNVLDPDVDMLTISLAESVVNVIRLTEKLPCKKKKTRYELLARLEVARTFITDTKNQTLSLHDIERASCLSRYHLNRSFAHVYGAPPLRFHQNLKLDNARKQIEAGVPQRVIAQELGFSTTSAFSRAYRRHHQHAPSKDK